MTHADDELVEACEMAVHMISAFNNLVPEENKFFIKTTYELKKALKSAKGGE